MMVSLRLTDEDAKLISQYAKLKGMSVSELMRRSVLEQIEDEIDLKAYERALAEYKANPATYTLDEAERELGL